MKHVLKSFRIIDVVIIAILAAAMAFGMTRYVSPLAEAKEEMIGKINAYPVEEYMEDDYPAIDELKQSYAEPVNSATMMTDLDGIYEQFETEVKAFKTRSQYVEEYAKKLDEPIANIYSDEDRESAKKIAAKFQEKAAGMTKLADLKSAYGDAKSEIENSFKTKEQAEKEQQDVYYLIGTWSVPGSDEYPFKLDIDGTFTMDISYKTTFTSSDGKITTEINSGALIGRWYVSEDYNQLYISIDKNSLDPDYKQYYWIFNYNREQYYLEGTGVYAGWVYYKN